MLWLWCSHFTFFIFWTFFDCDRPNVHRRAECQQKCFIFLLFKNKHILQKCSENSFLRRRRCEYNKGTLCKTGGYWSSWYWCWQMGQRKKKTTQTLKTKTAGAWKKAFWCCSVREELMFSMSIFAVSSCWLLVDSVSRKKKNICERLGDLRRSDLRADVFMIN